eukprot:g1031.t1
MDALAFTSGFFPIHGVAARCIKARNFRIIRRGRSSQNTSTTCPQVHNRLGCQGRALCPCSLAASLHSSISSKKWGRLRFTNCYAQLGEDNASIDEGSNLVFHSLSSSKPTVWNPSYKRRLNKAGVGGDFQYHDTALSALQSGVYGLCDSHDATVSRRAFLKSLINGRMKDIGYNPGTSGAGDDGNGTGGRRGYGGGSDGDSNFGPSESWGWNGIVLAGTRGWVFIAAAITLVSSIFAQVFRTTGTPASRSGGSITSTPTASNQNSSTTATADSDGVKLHLQKGGSLSNASSARSFRGSKNKSPKKGNESTSVWSFALSDQAGLWTQDEDSNELEYRRCFQGVLYPPLPANSRAFYRKAAKKVARKVGDWVETVDAEDEASYQLLNETLESGGLEGMIPKPEAEPSTSNGHIPSEDEVYGLRDELKNVHRLLKRSETKRHEAIQKLKQNSVDFEEKELALRAKIKTQEDANQKIRVKLRKIDTERVALMRTLESAKGSFSAMNPEIEEVNGHVNELSNEIQTYRTSLRLMENQLVLTTRERDAVVRRMDILIRDVHDMECVLDVAQQSQELIVGSENEAFAEKIKKTDNCIQSLQRFDMKPNGGRQLSPIQEVNQRVVIVFKKLLSEMRRSFMQSSKCVSRLEAIQVDFANALQIEKDLKEQLGILKEQLETIEEEKKTSESVMASLQNDLVNVHQQLDGNADHEEKLTQAIAELTSNKDEISEMARKFKREIDDVENLLGALDSTKELILETTPGDMGVEHIVMLENCISGLQHQQLALADSTSPVTESISNRLVNVFEELLMQTKQCLVKSEDAKKSLKRVEEDLNGALAQEQSLNFTLEGLKAQISEMSNTKCNLSNDVSLLKSEMEEKVRNLDQLKMELNELDTARNEQAKEISSLQDELEIKKQMVEDSKEAEFKLMEAINTITEERDDLLTKLDINEADLGQWKASLEEVVVDRKRVEEERDTLQAEKTKLETQLSGLAHRINDFESENSRLNSVAQTLRSNLDNERREKEQLEQEAEDIVDQRTDLQETFTSEVQGLKERLEDAQQDCIKLKETCEALEQAKVTLEKQLEDEHEKFNSQLEKLKEQHQAKAGPSAQTEGTVMVVPESPFFEQDRVERSQSALPQMDDNAPSQRPPYSSEIVPMDYNDELDEPESSKVRNWLEQAEVIDPWGSVPSERDVVTAPLDKNTDEILETLMPATGAMREQRIFRRSSWPQDMTNALSDNLFGAAQELVDMTTATLALAAEKNGLEQELSDVRQAITEARGQLEEREAEVGELTEHFLQVYQIASDLATDNEEQSNELRELRLMYERQKQDIEIRDERLTYLETEFAMLNKAPPRIPISKNHYSESVSSFPGAPVMPPVPTPFRGSQRPAVREFTNELTSRMNSFNGTGYESLVDMAGRSPRLDAPGTPSVVGAGLDPVRPRAQSSATNISVPTNQYDEADIRSMNYSIDDMSSLSGADDEDGSTAGYPEDDRQPIHVDSL